MEDSIEIVSMDGLNIYQAEKSQIDSQIATAKAFPRNMIKAKKDVISLIVMSETTAQKCIYGLPTGGKILSGPSSKLAKMLAKKWGNLRADARIFSEDQKSVTAEAVCMDLENNYAVKIQVHRSIWSSTGGRYSEHMINTTKQAAIAIALRNAIFQIIDEEIIDACYDAAKNKIAGNVSTKDLLLSKTKVMFDNIISSYKVTEKEILDLLRKSSADDVTKDDIVVLTGVVETLKAGEVTADDIFRSKYKAPVVNEEDKLEERILLLIKAVKTKEALEKLKPECKNPKTLKAYDEKLLEFKK